MLMLACFVLAAMAGPAPVTGPHLTLTPHAGYVFWDKEVNLKNSFMYGGTLGLMFCRYAGLEGEFDLTSPDTDKGTNIFTAPWNASPSYNADIRHYGGNLILNLTPNASIVPFLLGGWQETRSEVTFPNPSTGSGQPTDIKETKYRNGPEVGGGLKFRISPRTAIRFEVRDAIWKFDVPPAPDDNMTHNLYCTAGVEFAIGGSAKLKDSDADGVPDKRDNCPNTPLGARVDSHGCPIDSDGDGVYDGIDQCANTPHGATVDAKGCPTDADGDGVFDGLDQCANTPKGATVDAKGCPIDSDGDGVYDGIDQCPSTPQGVKVDLTGCPIEVSEKETQLLNTGMITERSIRFATAKWDILPGSYAVLDEIGGILIQWPQLKMEIGGHTDARGSDKSNLELSQKRANSVLEYLMTKFPQLDRNQYGAVGYGETKPVADNNTPEGMAMNRRVEFKVLNPEVLKKEVERRHLLKK
jgi:OOP family OmpA-OmpF porin